MDWGRKGQEPRFGKDFGDRNGVLVTIWKIFDYTVLHFTLVCDCFYVVGPLFYNSGGTSPCRHESATRCVNRTELYRRALWGLSRRIWSLYVEGYVAETRQRWRPVHRIQWMADPYSYKHISSMCVISFHSFHLLIRTRKQKKIYTPLYLWCRLVVLGLMCGST